MAKFVTKKKEERVVNHMGSLAYGQTPEMELAFAVITTFLEDSYYEKKDARADRIIELVKKCDPIFVAKLAVVARTEYHMRSVSHLLIAELARIHNGDDLVKRAIVAAAERPDDLIEMAAAYGAPEKNLPKQMKRGIRNALLKFSRYQLAKYRGEGKSVKLVDLFNITHPKAQHASQEQAQAWKDLIEGNLKSTGTWEVEVSAAAGDKEATKDAWEDLVLSGKIGYMALLRNLNNLIKNGVDMKVVLAAAKRLSDPEQVAKSKQLPFRFLSALEAVGAGTDRSGSLRFEDEEDTAVILQKALIAALEASIQNIPELPGRTVILTDNSGSMRGDAGGSSAISAMSKAKTASIANLFAVMYWKRANSTIVGVFGDRLETPKLDREKDIFENYKVIDKVGAGIGGGTEAGIFLMMSQLIKEKKMVDRIVIFSDSQVGEGNAWYGHMPAERAGDFNRLFREYKAINPGVLVYSVDLKGYGNSMFKDDVFKLAGWSEKIFELMHTIEKGDSLVDHINATQL